MCYLQMCHVVIIIIISGVMIQYKHKQKLTGCVVEERMYLEYITKDHIVIHRRLFQMTIKVKVMVYTLLAYSY